MRPAQRIKQVEETGRRLTVLLSSSIISQLLQRTPPAALTAGQEAQLASCDNVICQLQAALKEAPSLQMQLVDAMLKHQVARNVGSLVTWVQQQTEQQLLGFRAVAVAGHQGSAQVTCGSRTASMWADGVLLLGRFAMAYLHNSDSAGACSLAANLTQQLDQSGKACSSNCARTLRQCCGIRDSSCMHIQMYRTEHQQEFDM
jgi:hypothetical protein